MSPDGGRNNGLASSSHRDQNEYKEVADAAAEEGQGLSEEDESKINEAVGGLNPNQIGDAVPPEQQSGGLQKQQQQQSPGPIIRWERFLPIRTLKILLVEYDDSTRQVVSALLRNCSYEGKHSISWRFCFSFNSILL